MLGFRTYLSGIYHALKSGVIGKSALKGNHGRSPVASWLLSPRRTSAMYLLCFVSAAPAGAPSTTLAHSSMIDSRDGPSRSASDIFFQCSRAHKSKDVFGKSLSCRRRLWNSSPLAASLARSVLVALIGQARDEAGVGVCYAF